MSARSLEAIVAARNETAAALIARVGSKSAAIRALAKEGMSRGDISRYLEIRYQHVRNVLEQPLKRSE